MPHSVVLSADAIADIDEAFEYYNSRSYGLGFEFTDTLDAYFKKISHLPTASAIRYDNIRVKPIDTFHIPSISLLRMMGLSLSSASLILIGSHCVDQD